MVKSQKCLKMTYICIFLPGLIVSFSLCSLTIFNLKRIRSHALKCFADNYKFFRAQIMLCLCKLHKTFISAKKPQ